MRHIVALLRGFGYALRGIGYTIRTQRNMRIHLNAVALVVLVGLLAGFAAWQWAAVLLCCGLVTALELVNTAIEALCDRVSPDYDPAIGLVKDAAAGAVLAAAIASVAVAAAVLFGGGGWTALLQALRTSIWKVVLLALALAATAAHVLFLSAVGTGKGTKR